MPYWQLAVGWWTTAIISDDTSCGPTCAVTVVFEIGNVKAMCQRERRKEGEIFQIPRLILRIADAAVCPGLSVRSLWDYLVFVFIKSRIQSVV